MEARLYELILDYQHHRGDSLTGRALEFRENALREFARLRPDSFPEYFVDETRLHRALVAARMSGEIVRVEINRDDWFILRQDSI